MALRRPLLLACIVTVVLGIRSWTHDNQNKTFSLKMRLLPAARKSIPGYGTIVVLKQLSLSEVLETASLSRYAHAMSSQLQRKAGSGYGVARNAEPVCQRIPELHSFLELLGEWIGRKRCIPNPMCFLKPLHFESMSPLLRAEKGFLNISTVKDNDLFLQLQNVSAQVSFWRRSTTYEPTASVLGYINRQSFATTGNRKGWKFANITCSFSGTNHESEEHDDICSFLYLFPEAPKPRLNYFQNIFGIDDDPDNGMSRTSSETPADQGLPLVSLCVTGGVLGGKRIRRIVLPALKSLPSVSITQLVQGAVKGCNLSNSHRGENGKFETEMQMMSSLWRSDLPGLKSDFFSHQLYHRRRRQDSVISKWSSWSLWMNGVIPRAPVFYWIHPLTSFLPSMGTSAKESMAHLGSRLASLNALPASCNISRVRLAEAGFYYDNSKTVRDASNVHEVVCYSCGLAYSQWKKGDNPVTIHSNLRPDCEHIRGRNASLSTPSASSGDAGQSPLPDSSTLSSGHGSFMTESSQGSSVPQSSLSTADSGIGTGSFGSGVAGSRDYVGNGMPEERRDGDRRSEGSDLATDCSSIPPTTLARPSNQSLSSGMSRDSSTPRQPSYQSSYSSSRDTSRARAQDLDDRPPLDMGCAVYPQFCRHQERRATFSTWPLANLFHPDDLVMQGFYYAGYADCLRCFYCGVGLKSWAEDDDVMLEHIRWRPSCGYVLNTKGRQFVQSVLNSLGQINSTGEQNDSSRDSSNGTPQPSPAPETTNSPSNGTAAENNTTTATQAPAARSLNASTSANTIASSASASASTSSSAGGNTSKEVLKKVEEMGFSKGAIARAVRHFQQAGMTKTSVDALVEKILELDLEDNNATAANSAQREGLQTDGPEGASNYDLDADIQRAQRIISENARLKARQTCKICKRSQVGMIFLPCGHILACTQCGSKTKNCTHCGEFIRATANVYLS